MLVAFRVDASVQLGSGHVVRCTALARALSLAGARTVFLGAEGPGNMLGWLASQGWEAIALPSAHCSSDSPPWQIDAAVDADHTLKALGRLRARPDWLVADHYGIEARWEAAVRPAVERVLVIDDLANRPHLADTLVDPNIQQRADRYRAWIPTHCRTLLGPRFALLREEFSDLARTLPRDSRKPVRLLACMGGTDPLNALSTVLDAWEMLPAPRPELDVAVGSGSPNLDDLRERCAFTSGMTLHVQTQNIAALMARADLLLGSAGSISWERCSMGLPAIMGTTADNQLSNLVMLARARTGISIGDWRHLSAGRLATLIERVLAKPQLVARMAARSRLLADARGATRVSMHMAATTVTLRPAQPQDGTVAWQWRNTESTRCYFHDPQPIALQAHLSWWNTTLADPMRELLIAEIGKTSVGVLRLDHERTHATLSIYLDPQFVGLGIGPEALRAAQGFSADRHPGMPLLAHILPQNAASIASFEAAGFVRFSGHWRWKPAP